MDPIRLMAFVGADISQFDRAMQQVAGRSSMTWRQVAAGTAIGQLGIQAVSKAVGFAKSAIIDYNSTIQQYRIGMTQLEGSASKASAELTYLQKLANTTPFEMPGLVQSYQQLKAMGQSAKITTTDVNKMLVAAGDASAALGKGTEGTQRITLAWGQMMSTGVIHTQDMNQIAQVGVNGFALLAKHAGISEAAMRKMVQKGTVPASEAVKAMAAEIEKSNMGGAMQKQSRSFQGAMSTIHDMANMLIGGAFKPLFDQLTKGALVLGDFLQTDKAAAWAKSFAGGLGRVASGVVTSIKWLAAGGKAVKGWISSASGFKVIGAVLTTLEDKFKQFAMIGKSIFTGDWSKSITFVSDSQFQKIQAFIGNVKNAFGTAQKSVGAFFNALKTGNAGNAGGVIGLMADAGVRLRNELNFIYTAFLKTFGWLKDNAGFVGVFVTALLAFAKVRAVIESLVTIFGVLRAVVLTNPIFLISAVAAALFAHFVMAQKGVNNFADALKFMGTFVKQNIVPIFSAVVGFLTGTLIPVLENIGGPILAGAIDGFDTFFTGVLTAVHGIVKIFDTLSTAIGPSLRGISQVLGVAFGVGLDAVLRFVGTALTALGKFAGWLGDHQAVVLALAAAISTAFLVMAGPAIGTFVILAIRALAGFVTSAWGAAAGVQAAMATATFGISLAVGAIVFALASVFGQSSGPSKQMIAFGERISNTASDISSAFSQRIPKSTADLASSFKASTAAMISTGLEPLNAAFKKNQEAADKFANSGFADKFQKNADQFKSAIASIKGAAGDPTKQLDLLYKALHNLPTGLDKESSKKLQQSVLDLGKSFGSSLNNVEAVAKKFHISMNDVFDFANKNGIDAASMSVSTFTQKFSDLYNTASQANTVKGKWSDAMNALSSTTSSASDRVTGLQDALDALIGKDIDFRKAQDEVTRAALGVTDAQAAYAQAVATSGGKSEDATKALLDLHDAQNNNLSAVKDLTVAFANHDGTVNKSSIPAIDALIHSLQTGYTNFGITKQAAAEYILKLKGIERTITTTATLNAGGALTDLKKLNDAVDALAKKGITAPAAVAAATSTSSGNVGKHGTVNANGGLYDAQIKPGSGNGLMQWAEGSTGGEAFIPLGSHKRGRSEAILKEVAKRFGLKTTPMANGGILNFQPVADSADAFAKAQITATAQRAAAAVGALVAGMNGSSSGGVQQWAPLVIQVLKQLGQPLTYLSNVLAQMNLESGGNPNAINNTDSNAKIGQNSRGLMQVIPGTFAAYAGPYVGRGIYDPLANIYAGLNYAIHRYGSLGVLQGVQGYATGTKSVPQTGLAMLHQGEAVIPASAASSIPNWSAAQWKAFGAYLKAQAAMQKLNTKLTATSTFSAAYVNDPGFQALMMAKSQHTSLPSVVTSAVTFTNRFNTWTKAQQDAWIRYSAALQKNSKTVSPLTPLANAAHMSIMQYSQSLTKYYDGMQKAKAQAAQLDQKRADLTSSMQSNFSSGLSGALSDMGGKDLNSYGGADISKSLADYQKKITDWTADIKAIKTLGGSSDLVDALAQQGPDSTLAATISGSKDKSLVASLNKQYAGITSTQNAATAGIVNSLYAPGQSVINSFIAGMQKQMPQLKAFLAYVSKQIPAWKGPASYDKTLLHPAGQLIIQGLITGMKSQTTNVKSHLSDVGSIIAASGQEAASTLSATQASNNNSGGNTIIVQGSVFGEDEWMNKTFEYIKTRKRRGDNL